MKIVVEINGKRFVRKVYNNVLHKILNLISTVKSKWKIKQRKKHLLKKQKLRNIWIDGLRKRYGVEPPALLYDVEFERSKGKYIVRYVKRKSLKEEEIIGVIKKEKIVEVIEKGLCNLILSTRNIEIDYTNKCLIFYNSQTIHVIKPVKITYTHMTSTLEIEDGTGKIYKCSFTPYVNYMPMVLEVCKTLL